MAIKVALNRNLLLRNIRDGMLVSRHKGDGRVNTLSKLWQSQYLWFSLIVIGSIATGMALAIGQFGWALFNAFIVAVNIHNYFNTRQ